MENQQPIIARQMASEEPHDLIREIIYQIRRLMQAGELYTKELNRKYQISAAQLNCLVALFEQGPLSLSQIAGYMMVRASTVTGVVDRLEQKDLVLRVRDSPDRRIITIQLTDTGKKLAEKAPPPIQKKIIDGLTKLPEAEIRRIVGALNNLTTMLDVQELEVEFSDQDT
ncbi:MAG: MarR family transcriptional regulator [Desulfobacteraceae bacterium]|nr:MarR family transcriptional regulator [Desulfobacteraceae bacterium]